METERPHRTTTSSNSSTSELFVCFTSRLSSSSMKLSSKSILSPSRSREPTQISLSSSLSRRLKSNGSMKGGQASPMFPTGGKKRGCAFENPEPSSPKVTCIGQVRVKTKKQGKKMRARSKRRGEASFRKTEQGFQVASNPDLTRQNSQSFQYQNHQQECLRHRNQRWVHLPLTICEALRGFGAEFNCFLPCRSSCMSSEREKEEKVAAAAGGGGAEGSGGGGHDREGSCGAAFARWLVTLQDGDAKGRERRHVFEDVDIHELVMEEEEEEEDDRTIGAERSQRRHVFQDIDIDLEVKKNEEFAGEEEEKRRVSICIPPKNALLLMRCRSDPVKMAALANRFWESPVQKNEDEDDDNVDKEEQEEEEEEEGEEEQIEMEEDEGVQEKIEEGTMSSEEHVIPEAIEAKPEVEEEVFESRANTETNEVPEANQVKEEEEEEEEEEEKVDEDEDDENGEGNANHQDEIFSGVSTPEIQIDLEKPEAEEFQPSLQQQDEEKLKEKENEESSELASSPAFSAASEPENNEAATTGESAIALAAAGMAEASAEGSTEEEQKGTADRPMEDEETATACDGSDPRPHVGPESKERGKGSSSERERGSSGLPECLLLMMCEPKLSMEVSKETWVCSTDFIRWLPERPVRKTDGGGVDGDPKKGVAVDSKQRQLPAPPQQPPPLLQPPRSSCSFPAPAAPAGMSMATMIEQKLVGSSAYEPFVLTRCKSEPMRSSAKLAPEACFWKNRKLEPHPPATLGVGAAGVGF